MFKLFFILISNLVTYSLEDVDVVPSDCDDERYDNINTVDQSVTKNLIFESNLNKVTFVLNCTFCDHIVNGRDVNDGKWYMKKHMEGEFLKITKNNFPDFEILEDNRLKIDRYRKNIGFYNCHPDRSFSNIKIITLVDHIEDRNLIESNRFKFQEEFTKHSIELVNRIENEIKQSLDVAFDQKYKLIYDYYKETSCSRCNQIGLKDMIYKCRLTEISFCKSNHKKHVEPSVSCESEILKHYNSKIYNRIKILPAMSFKFPCNVSCDLSLPNLTEISVTEKPSIINVFEDESKKFLKKILMRVGIYSNPDRIKPDFNLMKINLTSLVERSLKLTCPIDKLMEDRNFVFWYFNYKLISSLKLRIMTDDICRIHQNSIVFDSVQPEFSGSYICTYRTSQRQEFILNVEKYTSFDLRNPLNVYLLTIFMNLLIFIFYHLYLVLIHILGKKRKKRISFE